MAFVSIILAALFIFIIILAAIFGVGFIIALIGLITLLVTKKRGQKRIFPKVLLGIGCTIMGLIITFVLILVIYAAVTGAEYKSDQEVLEDIVITSQEAARTGDTQAIIDMFAPSVSSQPGFEESAEKYLHDFPYDYDSIDISTGGGSTGDDHRYIHGHFEIEKDGETYYGYIDTHYEDESDPSNVGVQRLTLVSQYVYCDYQFDLPDENGIYSEMVSPSVKDIRIIGGYPHAWFAANNDGISIKELREYSENQKRKIDDITEKFGTPNMMTDGAAVYLLSDMGSADDPHYADICFDYYGRVIYITIYSEDNYIESFDVDRK